MLSCSRWLESAVGAAEFPSPPHGAPAGAISTSGALCRARTLAVAKGDSSASSGATNLAASQVAAEGQQRGWRLKHPFGTSRAMGVSSTPPKGSSSTGSVPHAQSPEDAFGSGET